MNNVSCIGNTVFSPLGNYKFNTRMNEYTPYRYFDFTGKLVDIIQMKGR